MNKAISKEQKLHCDENCNKNCKGCSAENPRKECEYMNTACTGCGGYSEVCAKVKA